MVRRAASVVVGAAGAACGAVGAYFFDPDRGHARRARLHDQAAGTIRHSVRRVNRAARSSARYAAGRWRGRVYRLTHLRGQVPPDGATLADKVRSEVLGSARFAGTHITVDAVQGRVALRGQLADQADIEELERRVLHISGVHSVDNMVHTPGTPAPNKAAALRVSR